jgi:hypothetical protein
MIVTWTEKTLDILNPKPYQICIEDIAQGLSNTCRYNGQGLFYSVAEHSVHLANWCMWNRSNLKIAIHALLHDAAEAYLPDVSTPAKEIFPEFKACEERLLGVIHKTFDVRPIYAIDEKTIKNIDRRIVLNECKEIGLPSIANLPMYRHLKPLSTPVKEIFRWTPPEAYTKFLNLFKKLTHKKECGHPWFEQDLTPAGLTCRLCGKVNEI